jgi:hypothetical protein
MSEKVRVEVHLEPNQAAEIEEYRRRQAVIPSRMEAIRDLIDEGLEWGLRRPLIPEMTEPSGNLPTAAGR